MLLVRLVAGSAPCDGERERLSRRGQSIVLTILTMDEMDPMDPMDHSEMDPCAPNLRRTDPLDTKGWETG